MLSALLRVLPESGRDQRDVGWERELVVLGVLEEAVALVYITLAGIGIAKGTAEAGRRCLRLDSAWASARFWRNSLSCRAKDAAAGLRMRGWEAVWPADLPVHASTPVAPSLRSCFCYLSVVRGIGCV